MGAVEGVVECRKDYCAFAKFGKRLAWQNKINRSFKCVELAEFVGAWLGGIQLGDILVDWSGGGASPKPRLVLCKETAREMDTNVLFFVYFVESF